MATKLGDVWMKFRLDTSEAQRDLDNVKVRDEAAGARSPKKQEKEKGVTPSTVGTFGKTRSEMHQENYFRQLGAAIVKKAGGGLSGSPVAAVAVGVTGQAAPFLPPAAGGALLTAAKTAVAYGIASETAKILPEAFALGRDMAGESGKVFPRLDEIEKALDHVRETVVGLEAKVLSIFSGISDTSEHSNAVERLTGQLPDTDFYMKQNQAMNQAQREIDAAFDNWKKKEAPANTAKTLLDYFKRNITR